MRTDLAHVAMAVTNSPDSVSSAIYRRKDRRKQQAKGRTVEQLEGMPLRQGKNPKSNWWDSSSIGVSGLVDNILRSRAGKPWDEVYSELCERIAAGTFARYMLERALGHELAGYTSAVRVCPDTHDIQTTYCGQRWHAVTGSYIHPETRILCYAGRRRGRMLPRHLPTMPGIEEYRVEGGVVYMRRKGLWYEGHMTALPLPVGSTLGDTASYPPDMLIGMRPYCYQGEGMAPPPRWDIEQRKANFASIYGKTPKAYCTGVRKQLSHDELRRLGLFNYYTEE